MVTAKNIRDDQKLVEEFMVEMAILDQHDLGFKSFAYCSPEQGGHQGRVKFAAHKSELRTTSSFSVSIDANPSIVAGIPPDAATEKAAIEWVAANHKVLAAFWSKPETFTTRELMNALKPV